jgi:hypothetical protein
VTPLQGITVTARRPHPTTIELAAKHFTESHVTAAPIGNHLVSWRDPVCPQTEGLPPEFNAFITRRIVDTARAVGAPVADGRKACQTNIVVVFTTDPQGYLDLIAVKHPGLLGWHYAAQTRRLKSFNHPIESWYVTASVADNGMEQINSVWGYGDNIQPERSSLVRALIVVDWNKAQDFEAGTIGDYVSMLALSQPMRNGVATCDELPSILDLLSENCSDAEKPKAMTEADTALLKALYDINPTKRTVFARQAIARRLAAQLKH